MYTLGLYVNIQSIITARENTHTYAQERRDHAAEMEERRSKERETLRKSLPSGRDVVLETFYFMDFQSLCEMPKEEYKYLPCEVAVVEYTMHSGILRNFHKFVDPGARESVCVYKTDT